MLVLMISCILFLPIIPASPIHRAVQRFRTNVNYINPLYRLVTNIYQGNYKLAKHNRERRNQRQEQKKKKRLIKRKKVARRPRLIRREKTKFLNNPVKDSVPESSTISNIIPFHEVENGVFKTTDEKHIDDEVLREMLTEMQEMIQQILLNQNLKIQIEEGNLKTTTNEENLATKKINEDFDKNHEDYFVPSPRIDPVRYLYEIKYL